jgi:hypothetical protein
LINAEVLANAVRQHEGGSKTAGYGAPKAEQQQQQRNSHSSAGSSDSSRGRRLLTTSLDTIDEDLEWDGEADEEGEGEGDAVVVKQVDEEGEPQQQQQVASKGYAAVGDTASATASALWTSNKKQRMSPTAVSEEEEEEDSGSGSGSGSAGSNGIASAASAARTAIAALTLADNREREPAAVFHAGSGSNAHRSNGNSGGSGIRRSGTYLRRSALADLLESARSGGSNDSHTVFRPTRRMVFSTGIVNKGFVGDSFVGGQGNHLGGAVTAAEGARTKSGTSLVPLGAAFESVRGASIGSNNETTAAEGDDDIPAQTNGEFEDSFGRGVVGGYRRHQFQWPSRNGIEGTEEEEAAAPGAIQSYSKVVLSQGQALLDPEMSLSLGKNPLSWFTDRRKAYDAQQREFQAQSAAAQSIHPQNDVSHDIADFSLVRSLQSPSAVGTGTGAGVSAAVVVPSIVVTDRAAAAAVAATTTTTATTESGETSRALALPNSVVAGSSRSGGFSCEEQERQQQQLIQQQQQLLVQQQQDMQQLLLDSSASNSNYITLKLPAHSIRVGKSWESSKDGTVGSIMEVFNLSVPSGEGNEFSSGGVGATSAYLASTDAEVEIHCVILGAKLIVSDQS